MPLSSEEHRNGGEGFVLVAVAGLLLLLSIVALAIMLASRSYIAARAARQANAEVVALADGVARLTAYRLAVERDSPGSPSALPLDGTPVFCRQNGMSVEVRITDTAGLVDLNAAREDTFEKLLIGMGLTTNDAVHLAAAIQDFRDTDAIAQAKGAEAQSYATAGRKYGPKNAPFESIQELDQVLGMTPELFRRMRSLVTVHSHASDIDPKVAPLELLRAFAVAETGSPNIDTVNRDSVPLPSQITRRFSGRNSRTRLAIMLVRVTGVTPGGTRFIREATVELARQAPSGFTIRDWSMVPAEESIASVAPTAAMPCFATR